MAVLDRRRGGHLVDVAMVEVAMSALCGPALLTAVEPAARRRGPGNRDIATAPSTTFAAGTDTPTSTPAWTSTGRGCAPWSAATTGDPSSGWPTPAGSRPPSPRGPRPDGRRGLPRDGRTGRPRRTGPRAADALVDQRRRRPGAVVDGSDGAAVPQFPVDFSGERVPREPAPALAEEAHS